MRFFLILLPIACLIGGTTVLAEDLPSFNLEVSAWTATDIVVATEGTKIDGKLTVIETWKGDLKRDEEVSLPDLAGFAPESARLVSRGFWEKDDPTKLPIHVSGHRMVLFLTKSTTDAGKWEPTGRHKAIEASVVWIDGGQTYSFIQWMNPGPSKLMSLDKSADDFIAEASEIVKTQSSIATAASIDDLKDRAETLKPFITSKHYFAPDAALHEMEKCGTAAMPILSTLIADDALLRQHGKYVETMGKACGAAAGPALTRVVATEAKFWKERIPTLDPLWQHYGTSNLPLDEMLDLNGRLSRLAEALRALKESRYAESKGVVSELRSNFQSILLRKGEGDDVKWVIPACDETLKALEQSGTK